MVLYVDLDSLPASTLRHLALREERERTRDATRYIDYQAMAEELAIMLCEGKPPTIGWYRRHLRPPRSDTTPEKIKSAPLGGDRPPAPPLASGPMRERLYEPPGGSHAWATSGRRTVRSKGSSR
jgi:hypothetical protein